MDMVVGTLDDSLSIVCGVAGSGISSGCNLVTGRVADSTNLDKRVVVIEAAKNHCLVT